MTEHRRGQLLDGRYRIEDTLGEGGMGYVVRARHVELDQAVAIKLMRRGVNPVWGKRFLREARAASRIESEHVARVYDCLLYTSPSPRDQRGSRMPSSA